MALTWPISPLIRVGIHLTSAGLTYLEQKGYINLLDEVDEQGGMEWRRLQCTFTRSTPTGTNEDVAVCTFDLVNFTDGVVDPTWTTGDYEAAEALFDTWWMAVRARTVTGTSFQSYRWYRRSFPLSQQFGPPLRVTSDPVPGMVSAAETQPFQVACSVTEITPIPRSWGRFYLPGIGGDNLDNYGRWSSTCMDAIADATEALYEGLYTAQLVPCVPMAAAETLLNVQKIQVDDIPDVIRRRRASTTLLRDTRVLGT